LGAYRLDAENARARDQTPKLGRHHLPEPRSDADKSVR